MLPKTVDFKIQKNIDKDIHSIQLYRVCKTEEGEENTTYIDSFSPMSKIELHALKNFLQEYLHNNDWY